MIPGGFVRVCGSALVVVMLVPGPGRGQNEAGAANSLKTARAAQSLAPLEIALAECEELDSKTKEEILDLRIQSVQRYGQLLEGTYVPSEQVFGRIVSAKPWWGTQGQFCDGNIEGPSEETRFFLNPFLLLGVDEVEFFWVRGDCFPAYPRAVSLTWDAARSTARARYDYTRLESERRQNGLHATVRPEGFFLQNYNARDFGFGYVYAVASESSNIVAADPSRVFEELCVLKSYIHLGTSCGYPGGCNNASPVQPELSFAVRGVPARLYCKLWKQRPETLDEAADFIYIIEFE